MSWSEIVFGSCLVVVLVTLSLLVGRRQILQLRKLRTQALPDEEMRWERRKAWRRLVSSALLFLLAALFVGLLVAYEPEAGRLADEREAFEQANAPPFTPEQRVFLRVWGGLVLAILLVLLAVVFLAGVDLWATRRYAFRQFRKLQADRRAMVERQAQRMRQERNGHG